MLASPPQVCPSDAVPQWLWLERWKVSVANVVPAPTVGVGVIPGVAVGVDPGVGVTVGDGVAITAGVGDGVGVGLGEGAVDAGTQTDADHKTANSGDQQDNALHDAGAVGVLQMSMLDPAEQVLLCRDADATADNEAERGQHETVAPGLE